uniref:DNA damage-inducible protein 1 n=1 Tax=Kwoniella dejecticola CBS 10117 TaxID=1296121 RepID=A0A1A6AB20_9TREE|nr:DNA damage-inducible protein 1 [Kwoniella dejecticola CBS 10117]OBR87252.1 DNA damage-inducible protein 1 [Kwoniella dejecticola CBS 10117]
MKLTIIAPDTVYEHEVSTDMEVQDVQALIEAETGLPHTSLLLSTDSGVPLTDFKRTLQSYGLTGDQSTIFLTSKSQAVASSSSASGSGSQHINYLDGSDGDVERMRLQALGNPRLMEHIQQSDPEMYAAIQGGTQTFKKALLQVEQRKREAAAEKQRQIELLNADPYDIEAQKKIEEAIRQEAIMENMAHAMEYSPESFGNVTMLYINVEVNGHPFKAFVDSGAQSTIITTEFAEACGIMRLLDTRFEAMAMGVGTAKILGRIHSTQIKLGTQYLPCSFSVLEGGSSVGLLFGLDMLKRHQCCIDLSTNSLRINGIDVPFLPEHEIPTGPLHLGSAEVAGDVRNAATQGAKAGVGSPPLPMKPIPRSGPSTSGGPAGPSTAASGASGGQRLGGSSASETKIKEEDIQTLIGLGAPRDHAIQLLQATRGNVDVAASMLFG